MRARPQRLATRLLVIVSTGVMLCACIAATAPQSLRGELVIEVERHPGVPAGSLYLKPLPGRLLGASAGPELFRSSMRSHTVELEVAELTGKLHEHLALAHSDSSNPGELANPRDLRMARLAAFFEPQVRARDCDNFATRLEAGHGSVLVYVDRRGTIRGSRYARPWIMRYELEFPEPGLYLVGARRQGMVITQRVVAPATSLTARVRRTACS